MLDLTSRSPIFVRFYKGKNEPIIERVLGVRFNAQDCKMEYKLVIKARNREVEESIWRDVIASEGNLQKIEEYNMRDNGTVKGIRDRLVATMNSMKSWQEIRLNGNAQYFDGDEMVWLAEEVTDMYCDIDEGIIIRVQWKESTATWEPLNKEWEKHYLVEAFRKREPKKYEDAHERKKNQNYLSITEGPRNRVKAPRKISDKQNKKQNAALIPDESFLDDLSDRSIESDEDYMDDDEVVKKRPRMSGRNERSRKNVARKSPDTVIRETRALIEARRKLPKVSKNREDSAAVYMPIAAQKGFENKRKRQHLIPAIRKENSPAPTGESSSSSSRPSNTETTCSRKSLTSISTPECSRSESFSVPISSLRLKSATSHVPALANSSSVASKPKVSTLLTQQLLSPSTSAKRTLPAPTGSAESSRSSSSAGPSNTQTANSRKSHTSANKKRGHDQPIPPASESLSLPRFSSNLESTTSPGPVPANSSAAAANPENSKLLTQQLQFSSTPAKRTLPAPTGSAESARSSSFAKPSITQPAASRKLLTSDNNGSDQDQPIAPASRTSTPGRSSSDKQASPSFQSSSLRLKSSTSHVPASANSSPPASKPEKSTLLIQQLQSSSTSAPTGSAESARSSSSAEPPNTQSAASRKSLTSTNNESNQDHLIPPASESPSMPSSSLHLKSTTSHVPAFANSSVAASHPESSTLLTQQLISSSTPEYDNRPCDNRPNDSRPDLEYLKEASKEYQNRLALTLTSSTSWTPESFLSISAPSLVYTFANEDLFSGNTFTETALQSFLKIPNGDRCFVLHRLFEETSDAVSKNSESGIRYAERLLNILIRLQSENSSHNRPAWILKTNDGRTPFLHLAVNTKHEKLFKQTLEMPGPSLQDIESFGLNAADYAVSNDSTEIFELLCQMGLFPMCCSSYMMSSTTKELMNHKMKEIKAEIGEAIKRRLKWDNELRQKTYIGVPHMICLHGDRTLTFEVPASLIGRTYYLLIFSIIYHPGRNQFEEWIVTKLNGPVILNGHELIPGKTKVGYVFEVPEVRLSNTIKVNLDVEPYFPHRVFSVIQLLTKRTRFLT